MAMSQAEQFWAQVIINGEDEIWPWIGTVKHGVPWFKGKPAVQWVMSSLGKDCAFGVQNTRNNAMDMNPRHLECKLIPAIQDVVEEVIEEESKPAPDSEPSPPSDEES